MPVNLIDMLKSQIGGPLASQLGKQFGESEQSAKLGIDALVPTILAGLLKQVTAPGGAEKLDNTIKDGGYEGGLLDDLSGMFSSGGSDALSQKGGGLVSALFGDKAAMIAPIVARLTGMKSGSITSILVVLAPLIVSFLGKQKKLMGLDANGLATLLITQKDAIGAALPLGIADAVGLAGMGGGVAGPNGRSVAPVAAGGGGLAKVLIPLLIVAAVGFGAYKYIFAGIRPSGAAGNTVVDTSGLTESTSGEIAPSDAQSVPAVEETPAPESNSDDGGKLSGLGMPAGLGALPDMRSVFDSLGGVLGKVKDAETARVALPDLEAMDTKLQGLSTGLSLLPAEMKTKLTEAIKERLPDFQAAMDKVMALPGVKEVLQPILDKVMEKVKAMSV